MPRSDRRLSCDSRISHWCGIHTHRRFSLQFSGGVLDVVEYLLHLLKDDGSADHLTLSVA